MLKDFLAGRRNFNCIIVMIKKKIREANNKAHLGEVLYIVNLFFF